MSAVDSTFSMLCLFFPHFRKKIRKEEDTHNRSVRNADETELLGCESLYVRWKGLEERIGERGEAVFYPSHTHTHTYIHTGERQRERGTAPIYTFYITYIHIYMYRL